ncbi:hypothetical protein UFOVP1147_2 [uncultured Caudovirales phage]|uniref:Uncharacterized protein n=1 Tax=uncultured Caudovirales phage TaxID=2100421 RepID=A0A6J5R0L7_9CAUD|nr:hypothetical protein UFOVP484_13 [uncultured Caudovirales phage]CAB4163579.1 hypothetical protein UFOVP808_29 [uncultured Caudovirales phage]CAB4175998.1 hypothetical protein UFOVP994_56 [uncultured Caudovirales phage]CAB4186455.1 hypothetical protein UFOVP1147_2 [uncultured Caudovirales phage]CAB4217669.1 hypothetical protein UFOVP1594_56 [uncultured Caudovirales phage]
MLKTTNSVIQASQIATPIVFQSDVTLLSTDAGAAAAPLLDLYRNSASPAASDTIGEIEFNGQDSAGNKQQYAVIHASILSPTSTAETGQIHFETATGGASTEKMIIGTTNLVINDIGAIYNVRIEGDTDANLFFTDATNSRVGVGTISPAEKLDVVGNIKLTGNVVVASGQGIDFAATAGTGTSELLADYEEGTWTPTLGGTSVLSITEARYTKVGRVVTIQTTFSVTSLGTGSNYLVTGLPFTPAFSAAINVGYFALLSLAAVSVYAYVDNAAQLIVTPLTASGITANVSVAIFADSTIMRIAGSYTV